MPQSEAQKKATTKWRKENLAIISARVRKDIADDFKTICNNQGKAPYTVIKELILQYIADYKKSEQ